MNNPLVVTFSGKKGSGKDTAATFLYDFYRDRSDIQIIQTSFAEELKTEIANVLCTCICQFQSKDFKDVRKFFIDKLTIDRDFKEAIRPLLQWWGTEFRRDASGVWDAFFQELEDLTGIDGYDTVDPEYWVERLTENILNTKDSYEGEGELVFLVTDARFPNELKLEDCNMLNVKVVCSNDEESDDLHSSETALDDYNNWDFVIEAERGDLQNMKEQVSVLAKIVGHKARKVYAV